jgi:cell division protein FtsL
MNRSAILALAALWGVLLISAVGTVWAKQRARSLFVELQSLTAERDRLNVEWGQFKLEQGTLSTHAVVEPFARQNLQMVMPRLEEVRIVMQ